MDKGAHEARDVSEVRRGAAGLCWQAMSWSIRCSRPATGRCSAARCASSSPATAGIKAARAILANPPKPACIAASDVDARRAASTRDHPVQRQQLHDHNAEKANTPISGKEPEFFVKTADCVVGPDEPIVFDELMSKKIDCEVELAIVIGKAGRLIPAARALDHVFGYTIVNDVTARDRQVRRTPEGMTWYELGSGKAFDFERAARALHRHRRRDRRSAKAQAAIAHQRRTSAIEQHLEHDLDAAPSSSTSSRATSRSSPAWSSSPARRPAPRGRPTRNLAARASRQPGLVPATRYCLPGDVVECEIERSASCAIRSRRPARLRRTIPRARPQNNNGGQIRRSTQGGVHECSQMARRHGHGAADGARRHGGASADAGAEPGRHATSP